MTSAGFNKVVMRRIKQDSSVVSIFFVFPFWICNDFLQYTYNFE
jgi:hypothetical protein